MRISLPAFIIAFFTLFNPGFSQDVPFTRGINLTGWFQAPTAHQIQAGKYTLQDFQEIKSLGVDVIRLPINLHAMTNGAPNYILDPLFLEFLDQAVDWAESLEIYLILDNHTFDPAVGTDPNIGGILETVWTQMAEHYKNRTEFLIYEVLNEPHDISDEQWNSIQMGVVDAIRVVDQEHLIVIGPASWNSFHNLDDMPIYSQDRLIYTFHFYDPFVFTHQGATWTDPSMAPLGDVPFPYHASKMPVLPPSLASTWVGQAFNNYHNTGTVAQIQALIDIAVQFRESRNVPIFCGEFGTYIPNSNDLDRVYYYEVVRQYLEDNNIPWTMWDYHGGFGLFEEGGNGLFEHDLNVPLLESLGMTIPPQTPFVKQPETNGFPIYTDQIAANILESSSGESSINYYAEDSPNNDKYCLRWEDGPQYQYIGLDLKPDKDLSELVNQGHAIDFLFRGSAPIAFDIRFMDTDTEDPEDHPWRMRYTIDESVVPFDSRWHHLHIPLSEFSEQGAWEDQWLPPEGKFDWTDIDRLEIVAEHEDMGNARLWFDNLFITNVDSAQVLNDSVFELVTATNEENLTNKLSVYPNPAYNQLFIYSKTTSKSNTSASSNLSSNASSSANSSSIPNSSASSNSSSILVYEIMDNMGRVLMNSQFSQREVVDMSKLPAGIYLLRVRDHNETLSFQRILKN